MRYEPQGKVYKSKRRPLTPEQEEIVRRYAAEARKRAYEKLREREGR